MIDRPSHPLDPADLLAQRAWMRGGAGASRRRSPRDPKTIKALDLGEPE